MDSKEIPSSSSSSLQSTIDLCVFALKMVGVCSDAEMRREKGEDGRSGGGVGEDGGEGEEGMGRVRSRMETSLREHLDELLHGESTLMVEHDFNDVPCLLSEHIVTSPLTSCVLRWLARYPSDPLIHLTSTHVLDLSVLLREHTHSDRLLLEIAKSEEAMHSFQLDVDISSLFSQTYERFIEGRFDSNGH